MSEEVNWEDPSTRETFVVNQRTRNSYPCLRGVNTIEPSISSGGLRQGERVDEGEDVPGWLQEALEVCSHPISHHDC